MTDTGECEGQRGCLVPEVTKRKRPRPLRQQQHTPPVSSQWERKPARSFVNAMLGSLNLHLDRAMRDPTSVKSKLLGREQGR